MSLPPELASIADRLTTNALKNRNERIRLDLSRREDDAVRSGRQGMAYYRYEQEAACVREMNERLDVVWSVYKRIVCDAAVPWTDDVHQEVLERIKALIETDVAYVEELARPVIINHGHGFDLFLRNASPGMLERVTAEIELFAFKYRPTGTAVVLQLQSKRYAGPRRHWIEVQAALRESPPKLAHGAREAIHAVEALAKIVAQLPGATLGKCIEELKKRSVLDGGTANALDALWGLASNAQGVRHGDTTGEGIPAEKAEYIIGQSEAALKLLLSLDAPAV